MSYGMGEWGVMLPPKGKERKKNRVDRVAPPLKKNVLERFMKKIVVDDGHWIWQGAVTGGYGVITVDGQAKYAHRVAWEELKREKIAASRRIHPCPDVELCVYPGHLSLVSLRTQKEWHKKFKG